MHLKRGPGTFLLWEKEKLFIPINLKCVKFFMHSVMHQNTNIGRHIYKSNLD